MKTPIDRNLGQRKELIQETSGACYEAAKRVCALTNSYIVTDLEYRWKEVELDHSRATGRSKEWSPLAKAVQNAELKVFDNIKINDVYQLRKDGHLESMRHFFNRMWRTCRDTESFSETNAINLAAELDNEIHKADSEWQKIDQILLKISGIGAASLVAAVVAGAVGIYPAAAVAVVTGAAELLGAKWKRKSIINNSPAAFFLGMKTN